MQSQGVMPHAVHDGMTLEGEDQGRLVSVVNSALRVFNEKHFFSWVQGEVQYLFPHEILVCCTSVGPDSGMRFYPFSSLPGFLGNPLSDICNPDNGLLTRMMFSAREKCGAFVLSREFSTGGDASWLSVLERHDLENAAAHGLLSSDGRLKSYFCFFRIQGEIGRRTLYLLDILLPILDATLSRVVAMDGAKPKANRHQAESLAPREIQILHLIKVGMTNQMIAEELNLSPMTVKNHVQKILKKLRVNTRGHAVVHAINLGILAN